MGRRGELISYSVGVFWLLCLDGGAGGQVALPGSIDF